MIKDRIPMGDVPAVMPQAFPTFHSIKWLYRKAKPELLAEGVIVQINRRVLFDLDKLETFVSGRGGKV